MEIATGKVVGVRDTMVTSILKLEIRADILVAHPNYFSEIVHWGNPSLSTGYSIYEYMAL